MKAIIQPIDRDKIEQELCAELKLRDTNFGSNEIYVFDYNQAPSVMQEVGRLREVAFRDAGGGTGNETDIDEYDLVENGYKQLIVWDKEDREIVGGYRYIISNESDTKNLSTEHYFEFSDKFRNEYLPYSIELGRSFVQPKYQRRNLKSLYALDNLWDGIGALVVKNPHVKYFFGKVTMYDDYNSEARNLLIYFLKKYFDDPDKLKPVPRENPASASKIGVPFSGLVVWNLSKISGSVPVYPFCSSTFSVVLFAVFASAYIIVHISININIKNFFIPSLY